MIYGHCHDRNFSKLTQLLSKIPLMPLIGKGEALIQPVFIDDLLKAYEIALVNESFYGATFKIGAESPVTNRELFTIIASALGKK